MLCIRSGGFQPPCPKAAGMYVRLASIFCKQQREQRFFNPPSNIRYCGSRDEPPIPASGRNRIGGEIKRNEQSPLWGVATIELADTHHPGGVWGETPELYSLRTARNPLKRKQRIPDGSLIWVETAESCVLHGLMERGLSCYRTLLS